MSNILKTLAAGSVSGDYQIERSLRFNSADSAYLSRTPASAGNRQKWTWSGWVKRSTIGTTQTFFACRAASTPYTLIYFESSDKITFADDVITGQYTWTAAYRDVSAWYHIVIAVDTTQATASNRIKLYVNNVLDVKSAGTDPTLNASGNINSTNQHAISSMMPNSSSNYFNGYLADIHFVDGQQLTPSSFGEVDSVTGVWKPIAYAGTYGTNGFHLDFSDNSSTTALGYDAAGSNNWTPNNFSVTAGAGNDSLVDSPTQYGTDTGAGGEVRGNYATLNPLNRSANGTMSNGNLQVSDTDSTNADTSTGTISMKSGKYYFEFTRTATNNSSYYGIIRDDKYISGQAVGVNSGDFGYNLETNGTLRLNGSSTSSWITAFSANDVCMVAYDADTGKVWFGRNGTWGGSGDPASGTNATATVDSFSTYGYLPWLRVIGNLGTETSVANFGQRPFAYTAPSGFKALCTTNLPDPTVVQGDDHFNTVLYTGNGSTQSVTGVGFAPDFVWIKSRSTADYHWLFDRLRGVTNAMFSNTTSAENNYNNSLTAFGSDGFTSGSEGGTNGSGQSMVAWNWKANGAGVSNTDGTITSTVSANTTAGISIVTYTGNGNANATVGHGLGVIPAMIIVKQRNTTGPWYVKHASLSSNNNLLLNGTDAAYNVATGSSDGGLGNLSSATTFGFLAGTSNVSAVNENTGTFVALVFSEVEGFSKFGSYTGNGSTDGPFVYTGFRPAFILYKQTNTTRNWHIVDAVRDSYNAGNKQLYPNLSNAEYSAAVYNYDIVSNGFKLRGTDIDMNQSGGTYIYMAFAKNPFKYSLGR